MTGSLRSAVTAVRERIAAAAARAGRDAATVTLVAVTKGHPASVAGDAVAAGLTDLGENRVGELVDKAAAAPEARWHMVGRLQTNKVKALPDAVVAIHSVDRPSLIDRLAQHYEGRTPPDIYVEVNVSGEESKGGVPPLELAPLLEHLSLSGLEPVGLMTVARRVTRPEEARPTFAALARLAANHRLTGLSMGMSDDFEVAVEEGSTLVRVGRGIFGERSGFADLPR